MAKPVVAAYTIGQTPRPDLTDELERRFPPAHVEVHGALDGLGAEDIPEPRPRGYPLETRLQDGTRVVVDAEFLEPRLQLDITESDPRVAMHVLLCAGPFPTLAAPAPPAGSPVMTTPLIHPFRVAVEELDQRGFRRLDVMVPFADQAPPAMDKWADAGFACRAHVYAERPRHRSVGEWLSGLLRGTRAQGLVFDYVGLPTATLDEASAALSLPVFDLGHLALDAVEKTLNTL